MVTKLILDPSETASLKEILMPWQEFKVGNMNFKIDYQGPLKRKENWKLMSGPRNNFS